MKIINEEELLNAVAKIESFIAKNFNPTQMEYRMILQLLQEALNKRRMNKKQDDIVSSTLEKVKGMVG